MEGHQDLALVIAWPDVTARGDESWMAWLKRLGIVKNLNFRVGHAAIVSIHRLSGTLAYYDFGRYVSPRGYGRARSAVSDPRLALRTQAQFGPGGEISNLHDILAELHQLEYATHGGGRLFFAIATALSNTSATRWAQGIVDRGPVKYGAIARGNNSCSRFVAQFLLAGLPMGHPARRRLVLPESLKPSPMSNVVNASPGGMVHCYQNGVLESAAMTRWQSLRFQVDLLLHNFSKVKARLLPCDRRPGSMDEPNRPRSVPKAAHWLGGIGEGAWYLLDYAADEAAFQVVRYGVDGTEDYRANCTSDQSIDPDKPYRFTYQCHYARHVLVQHGQEIALETSNHPNQRIRTA